MAFALSSKLGIVILAIIFFLITSFSFMTTLLAALVMHVTQTRPYQSFKTSFYATTATTLETNISLQDAPLRSAAFIEAYLELTLPESTTNLNHPVFTIYTTLYAADDSCVAHTRRNAGLQFRSPTMRSLRVILFWVPIVLGVMNEYQSVNVAIMQYTPNGSTGGLHRMNIVLSAPLHVSSAAVNLLVQRRSFLGALWWYMPFIVMGTLGLSAVLLGWAFCSYLIAMLTNTMIDRMATLFGRRKRSQNAEQVENATGSEISMSSIRSHTSATTGATGEKFNNTLRMGTTALSLRPRRATRSTQAQTDTQ